MNANLFFYIKIAILMLASVAPMLALWGHPTSEGHRLTKKGLFVLCLLVLLLILTMANEYVGQRNATKATDKAAEVFGLQQQLITAQEGMRATQEEMRASMVFDHYYLLLRSSSFADNQVAIKFFMDNYKQYGDKLMGIVLSGTRLSYESAFSLSCVIVNEGKEGNLKPLATILEKLGNADSTFSKALANAGVYVLGNQFVDFIVQFINKANDPKREISVYLDLLQQCHVFYNDSPYAVIEKFSILCDSSTDISYFGGKFVPSSRTLFLLVKSKPTLDDSKLDWETHAGLVAAVDIVRKIQCGRKLNLRFVIRCLSGGDVTEFTWFSDDDSKDIFEDSSRLVKKNLTEGYLIPEMVPKSLQGLSKELIDDQAHLTDDVKEWDGEVKKLRLMFVAADFISSQAQGAPSQARALVRSYANLLTKYCKDNPWDRCAFLLLCEMALENEGGDGYAYIMKRLFYNELRNSAEEDRTVENPFLEGDLWCSAGKVLLGGYKRAPSAVTLKVALQSLLKGLSLNPLNATAQADISAVYAIAGDESDFQRHWYLTKKDSKNFPVEAPMSFSEAKKFWRHFYGFPKNADDNLFQHEVLNGK